MFRALLFLLAAGIVGCVVAYFVTGQPRYISWARRTLLAGLGTLVVFFAVLLVKRLI
jgi:hypothetical protein